MKITHLRAVLKGEASFISIAALLLVILSVGILLLPATTPPTEPASRSEKSRYIKDPFGYPDKFAEYFAAVEGLNDGYAPYPPGHKMREFQKAVEVNAKNGRTATPLNWIERGPGNVGGRSRAIILDPDDPSHDTWYVASVGGGVWRAKRSVSFGLQRVEWTPLTDDLPSLAATTLDLSRNNPNVMYFGTGEGFFNVDAASGIGIFKTTDKGETWTHLTASAVTGDSDWRYVNRLAVHPDNPDIVVVVTNGAIFRTEDGGRSFTKVHDVGRLRVQDLKVNPNDFNIQFASVVGTSILKSTDGGKTWQNSFSSFVHGAARIELAISPSQPEVIWASVEGAGGSRQDLDLYNRPAPIDDLYRSLDNGNTWQLLEFSSSAASAEKTFLGNQGWFDNSITVHPFSSDTVYVGGVFRWKAWVDSDGTFEIEGPSRFYNSAPFLDFISFGAAFAGGRLDAGYRLAEDGEAQDITVDEMTSVEVRFGPGLTQMAHRYTVDPNGGRNGDGGAGIALADYRYADYTEVPFQVWDTDNNRQLMVSFRDQARNGEWSLIPQNTDGPGDTHSREYIFISKYDYDASAPRSEYTEQGGFTKGVMYFFWPVLNADSDVAWDPDAPQPGTLDIDFSTLEGQYRTTKLWENGDVHVDHHGFTIVPINQSTNEFRILNVNDGGVAYSLDSGENWWQADETAGYSTAQFYDATKHPRIARYLGGTQDNGTWLSNLNPSDRGGWLDEEVLGGDGFDVIWKGNDSLMASAQGNLIGQSFRGGDFRFDQTILDFEGQFLTSIGWTPESKEIVFSISPEDGLLRSLEFGDNWHAIKPPNITAWGGGSGGKVRVSLADPNVVWAGYRLTAAGGGITLHVSETARNSISTSTSGIEGAVTVFLNRTWPYLDGREDAVGGGGAIEIRPVSTPNFTPIAPISGLATHPLERATAYVTFAVPCLPKVVRTTDMGDTWEDLSGFSDLGSCESTNGFPDAKVWDIEVFPDTPQVIWAATDLGIFESRDDGETWAYLDSGLPAVSVWRIRIVGDEVVLATHGRGIWALNLNQVQKTDRANTASELPDSFELLSNYPNPFNPSTTVSFRVAAESHIRVSVFDMLGRKVATLTDQPYTGGTHQVQWDASAMASGQYIYRMEANGKLVGAKAMLLLK